MSYMKAVGGRIESDVENSLSVIDEVADQRFIRYLCDQASCLKFFINSHCQISFGYNKKILSIPLIVKSKGRPCRVTTFIYNGFTSAVSSGTVNQRYPGTVTCAYAAAYRITFGAELGEVFILYIPCASHQPAAFCRFRYNITYSRHGFYLCIVAL